MTPFYLMDWPRKASPQAALEEAVRVFRLKHGNGPLTVWAHPQHADELAEIAGVTLEIAKLGRTPPTRHFWVREE